MKAELMSIGTELLLGQIVDTNAAYLAGRLALRGIDCLHMQTVGDNLGRATEAFRLALSRSDLVVATGGLGPTEDDLTREAIAAALGETPAVDADANIARIEREIRSRLGEYVWGTDDDTLGAVIGRALTERGWRLAVAESLSAGDIARALADAPDAARWFAGAVVRLGADADALARAGRDLGAEVLLLTPDGLSESELRAITPSRERRLPIRFRSPADGRRRALLSGLDLLRRTLGDDAPAVRPE